MSKKQFYFILFFVLGVIALALWHIRTASVPAGAWGLSFRTQGNAPIGPVDAQKLARFDAAYVDVCADKVLYLTFDAGYENGFTGQILDTLQKHNAPAAFFLTGNYLKTQPDLVRRMAADGHTVGNHTMTHPDMTALSADAFRRELEDLQALYFEITGQEMAKFYRPPQGIYSEQNLKFAQDFGYRTVFWSLAYADWDNSNQPDREYALDKLLTRTHPGAVVLLHATSQTNAQILDELLTRWEQMGYRFSTVEALFDAS